MNVLWIPVLDAPGPDSDRAYLEMNSLSLISGGAGPLDIPASTWLGRYSPHKAIRDSGLWNVNYVSGQYAPEFLDVFEQYVEAASGVRMPTRRLAPRKWYERLRQKPVKQIALFPQEGNIDD
jgi:hypothetical protein